MGQPTQGEQVAGQVLGDALAQLGDGLAHGQGAAVLLAGEKEELIAVVAHGAKKDLHRGLDHAALLQLVMTHLAQGVAKGVAHLGHQRQAKALHVGEVAIETRRHDPGLATHLAQAEAAEAAAAVHQQACRFQQRLARLQLLLGTDRHGEISEDKAAL